MRYKVMVSIDVVFSNGELETYEEEYSGTVYSSEENARKELLEARSDVNVSFAYLKYMED